MNDREPHVETITDDLHTVYSSLHRLSLPTLLKLDLTMAQFKPLVVVEASSGISVCEVGRELGIGESAASLLVDQIVRHGYVGRTTDPADRRRVLLAVTAPGKKLIRELRHGRRQSVRLVEVPVSERAPVLKEYVRTALSGRRHFPVAPGAPLSEFDTIADRYPVFRIDPR